MFQFIMVIALVFPLVFTIAALSAYVIGMRRDLEYRKHVEEAIALANEN